MEEEVRDFCLQCVHCSTVRHLYRAERSAAYDRNVGSYRSVLNWDYLFDPRPVEYEQYLRRDAVYLLFSRDPNNVYVNCSLVSATSLIRTETIAEMCRPYESKLQS